MSAKPLWDIFAQQPSMPNSACFTAVKEGVDPSLWDGKRENDSRTRSERESDTRHAKTICNICPEKLVCLEYVMREGIYTGIWGGMTEDERIALSKKTDEDVETRLCDRDRHVLPAGVDACRRCANAQSNARYRRQRKLRESEEELVSTGTDN